MQNRKAITPAITYFFKQLEKRARQLDYASEMEQEAHAEVPFDEVETFFRRIMTQNIFIHTVGISGRPESTILSKAVFSMNKVVRIYYSTSFDERDSGFVRIQPSIARQSIIVERLHGFRPKPELLYESAEECHVIRFMIRWLMRRIDWRKTKLNNLELYKQYQEQQRLEREARIEQEEKEKLEEQMAEAMQKLNRKV